MKLKPGVRVFGIRPEMVVALMVAEEVFKEYGSPLVVTSVTDGKHSRASLHYVGQAADLRTWYLEDPKKVAQRLQEALGEDFDVVAEPTHIHVEFQPKKGY